MSCTTTVRFLAICSKVKAAMKKVIYFLHPSDRANSFPFLRAWETFYTRRRKNSTAKKCRDRKTSRNERILERHFAQYCEKKQTHTHTHAHVVYTSSCH